MIRRRTLFGSAVALGMTGPRRGARAATPELTVVSFGGAYQEAESKALFRPGAAALGLGLKEQTYTGIAQLRLQVKSGAVTWDVVTSGSGSAAHAAAEGMLEKLDYGIIDVADFIPGTWQDDCVGGDVFSTVMAWNPATYGNHQPSSWADFWDVKAFPGKRAYRSAAAGALEPALMADGVPPDQVYATLAAPGGIARAIRKIKELKPSIAVWWASGAQHAQLMKDGEVDMATGWNGRFDAVARDGGKVAYTFNQALLDYDAYAIPKGAPHRDAAMRFLAEISRPQYQAELAKLIPYGPTNRKAYDLGLIDPDRARTLPSFPDNAAMQLPVDIAWYAKFEAQASEVYQNMLTE